MTTRIWCIALLTGCVADRPLRTVPVRLEAYTTHPHLALDTVEISLLSVHLNGPAATSVRFVPLLGPVRTAHGHPGHGATGATVGEWLGPWTGDLLDGPHTLGEASVYAGDIATGQVTMGTDTRVQLVGTVTPDHSATPLDIELDLTIDHTGTTLPLVATIPEEATTGVLEVSVDLDTALSFVDWSTADTDGDGRFTHLDSAFADSLTFGITNSQTWALALETP